MSEIWDQVYKALADTYDFVVPSGDPIRRFALRMQDASERARDPEKPKRTDEEIQAWLDDIKRGWRENAIKREMGLETILPEVSEPGYLERERGVVGPSETYNPFPEIADTITKTSTTPGIFGDASAEEIADLFQSALTRTAAPEPKKTTVSGPDSDGVYRVGSNQTYENRAGSYSKGGGTLGDGFASGVADVYRGIGFDEELAQAIGEGQTFNPATFTDQMIRTILSASGVGEGKDMLEKIIVKALSSDIPSTQKMGAELYQAQLSGDTEAIRAIMNSIGKRDTVEY